MSSLAVAVLEKMRAAQRMATQKTGARTLYNAAPHPVTFMCAGRTYAIPGLSDHEDGTLVVYDVYGYPPEKSQERRKAVKAGKPLKNIPQRLLTPSIDIVDHALRKLVSRGVCCLLGDPVEDEKLKQAARTAWMEYRDAEADKILNRYDNRRRQFYSLPRNQDQPPPAMTSQELEAEAWVSMRAREKSAARYKYVCKAKQCGFQTDDYAVFEAHVQVRHPQMEVAPPDEEPKDEEPKKGKLKR